MIVVNLYNGIYKMLSSDQVLLGYLGIQSTPTPLLKAKHIQKRSKPQDIANYIPLIAFYAPPGRVETGNNLVYCTPFIFDVYTKDDVELAMNICTRINQLVSDKINAVMGIESFESKFVASYESGTNLLNTFCFTVVIEMSVSLDN